MIFVQVVFTITLLIVSSFTPGLFFVRYLRWRPLETLCASVALSFLLLYFAALVIYTAVLPSGWACFPAAAGVLAAVFCTRDIRRLVRHRETCAAMLAFLALFFWLLLFLLLARNYSGARWWGDWYEHYERALFFSEHKPTNTTFLYPIGYALPARPPMMNLLTALLFWQVAPSFELFQVDFAYLNALSILPCALIAPSLVAKTRNRAWLIAGFLALSPMFIENGTYTWTKGFAAFYDLTALGLYLSACAAAISRMVAAFACLSIALLVHYSAAVMVLFLGCHYLFFLFRHRRHKWQEIIVSVAISIAIFMTWMGWSLYAYGAKVTFGSNTTVMGSERFTFWGNVSKIAENTFNTLVPFPLRGDFFDDPGVRSRLPPQGLALFRDWCFAIYQTEFPAMLGLGGLTLVVWQLVSLWRRPPKDRRQHRYAFWFWLVFVVTFLSIAVHGEYDYLGVAHICLQPVVLLGLTFAAVGMPHVPKAVRAIALTGLLVDAVLGILVHFYLLTNDFAWQSDPVEPTAHLEMGMKALGNGLLKFSHQLTFLGDHAVEFAAAIEVIIFMATLGIIVGLWLLAARSTPAVQLAPAASKPRADVRKKRPHRRR